MPTLIRSYARRMDSSSMEEQRLRGNIYIKCHCGTYIFVGQAPTIAALRDALAKPCPH